MVCLDYFKNFRIYGFVYLVQIAFDCRFVPLQSFGVAPPVNA